MLDGMVESSMGSYAKKYRNYIGSIFIFYFVSNISGLFGLRPPTADYGVTLPLGIITFCIIQYNNVKYNKFGAFTDLFKPIPILFPINLIGEIAVPFSLSLRLFGNVLSGTVMMSLIYHCFPRSQWAGRDFFIFTLIFLRCNTDLCVLYADNGIYFTENAAGKLKDVKTPEADPFAAGGRHQLATSRNHILIFRRYIPWMELQVRHWF